MTIKITVRKDGPYFIHPDQADQITLVDHEGNVIERPGKSYTLCRCGASTNKPFCDGTHSKIGFRGAAQAREEFDDEQAKAQLAQAQQAQSVPPKAGE